MKKGWLWIRIVSVLLITGGIGYGAYVYGGYIKGRQEYEDLRQIVICRYDNKDDQLAENQSTQQEVISQLETEPQIEKAQTPVQQTTKQQVLEPQTTERPWMTEQQTTRKPWMTEQRTTERQWMTEQQTPDSYRIAEQQMTEQQWLTDQRMAGLQIPERQRIDWDQLLAINQDVKGWLSIPALSLSYPVMQGQDNDYYLHRDIYQQYLFAGSLFMDAGNIGSLRDFNTVIYGHNMQDGSMFAALQELYRAVCEDNGEESRYFWIYAPAGDCLYEICSVYHTAADSDTYAIRFPDYGSHVRWLAEMSAYTYNGEHFTTDDRIVTLSTCTEDPAERLVVQGRLIWREDTADEQEK